jgi:hypothetical protein
MKIEIEIVGNDERITAIGRSKGTTITHSIKLVPKHAKEFGFQHKRDKARTVANRVVEAFIWRYEIEEESHQGGVSFCVENVGLDIRLF